MGDDEDFVEVAADNLDRLDELFEALLVLGAKTFVDKEGAKAGARAHGQDLGKRDAQGEIGAKCFAARVEMVGALANLVGDLDIKGFAGAALFKVAQRLKGDLDTVVGQLRENGVGLFSRFAAPRFR